VKNTHTQKKKSTVIVTYLVIKEKQMHHAT